MQRWRDKIHCTCIFGRPTFNSDKMKDTCTIREHMSQYAGETNTSEKGTKNNEEQSTF